MPRPANKSRTKVKSKVVARKAVTRAAPQKRGRKPGAISRIKIDGLVGRHFLVTNDQGAVTNVGRIEEKIGDGIFMCQPLHATTYEPNPALYLADMGTFMDNEGECLFFNTLDELDQWVANQKIIKMPEQNASDDNAGNDDLPNASDESIDLQGHGSA